MKFLFIFLTVLISTAHGDYDQVKLVENGYEGVVIAIKPNIPEDPTLIDSLKTIWTDASEALFRATKNRAYFKDITILVPTTWNKGSYGRAGKVSYDKADVIVAGSDSGDKPYTESWGGCGNHGKYIHLTPDYIRDDKGSYGPKGKVIVHEWAKLRWGVFDETPSTAADAFYVNEDGTLEATRCPASLKGDILRIYEADDGTIVSVPCEVDTTTGLPLVGECQFVPYDKQDADITTSMMAHYELDQVVHFCHDDESDPMNLHNKEARNDQNKYCDQRSTWDVITSSYDFKGQNYESNRTHVVPNFYDVQVKQSKKYVLVLDTSGSMGGSILGESESKMQNAITAAAEFITNYAPDNSYVGIVDFDGYATINSELVPLRTDEDRDELVKSLPTVGDAGGGTSLEKGAELAREMLVNSGNPEGEEILMLTDGQGSWNESVGEAIIHNGIVFNTIYFGVNEGNDFLTDLTNDTQGEWTIARDLVGLYDIFEKISHVDTGSTADRSFQVKSESVYVSGGDVTGSVSIDSTIGKDTVFSFTYTRSSVPDIKLYDPSGKRFCTEGDITSGCDSTTTGKVDTTFKTITFKIPGIAMSGSWRYDLDAALGITVTVSISSMAADPNVEPIEVKSEMSTTAIDTATPIVVYAQIAQGFQPILNAEVHAVITDPYGGTTDLILQDQGTAPDIRKSDGVYSKYFLDYSVNGRYSVKVQVIGRGNETRSTSTSYADINVVKLDGKRFHSHNHKVNAGKYSVDSAALDPFERVESLGGFEYTGPVLSDSVDAFPPSKIIDLRAEQVDVDNSEEGFQLLFTASGDDYDKGTAQRYDIRYAFNDTSSLVTNFDSMPQLQNSSILFGDLESPRLAGSDEIFMAKLDIQSTIDAVVRIGFAVKAYDEAGHGGEVSNVALLDFFLVPPAVILNPCIGRNGEIYYGDVFPVPGHCDKFYKCEVTGEAIEMSCSPGLVYNPAELVCDFPQNVPGCN